jgi:hypothetical protein
MQVDSNFALYFAKNIFMRKNLFFIGMSMCAFGIISTLLYFFEYNLRFMRWVDSWGDVKGFWIRGAFIVAGFILAALTFPTKNANQEENHKHRQP